MTPSALQTFMINTPLSTCCIHGQEEKKHTSKITGEKHSTRSKSEKLKQMLAGGAGAAVRLAVLGTSKKTLSEMESGAHSRAKGQADMEPERPEGTATWPATDGGGVGGWKKRGACPLSAAQPLRLRRWGFRDMPTHTATHFWCGPAIRVEARSSKLALK